MLDVKRIRMNPDEVKDLLKKRGGDYPIDEVLDLDKKRRDLLQEVEAKKAEQNKASKEVGMKKAKGEDAEEVIASLGALSDEISKMDKEVKEIEEKIHDLLLGIPNTPDAKVPIGKSDEENIEVFKWGEPRDFDFEAKAHWDLGTDLGILDFERATKIAGTRFTAFRGRGAQLERAIIDFMLTTHTNEHGYTEYMMPAIANREAMTGTGQLPKFEFDMFKLEDKDLFLIPTAEVPLTNLYGGEILDGDDLPRKMTAYTPCFRAEAGSAGRDTRGLIRNHQFDKVELVKLVKEEDSFDELEKLTNDAEEILQRLELPYRKVILCSGDLGFSSTMTYDLEVWMPSYGRYVEISSCSNFLDYQARRANLRYRGEDGKVHFAHTLNGSGLAVGRCFAAILENYQNDDGSVTIPEVLRARMGIDKIEK